MQGASQFCSMKFDPNDLQASCCPGKSPFPVFNKGKWHDPDCAELKTNMKQLELDIDQIFAPVPPKKNKCTCGSASLGSDRHSDWCDGK